jgi:hypothetical protein
LFEKRNSQNSLGLDQPQLTIVPYQLQLLSYFSLSDMFADIMGEVFAPLLSNLPAFSKQDVIIMFFLGLPRFCTRVADHSIGVK